MSDPIASLSKQLPTAVRDEEGERCPGCRRPLPIRGKLPGEKAAHWECAACHSLMSGIILKDAKPQAFETIRLGQIHFATKGVPRLSSSLRQLVREFVACRIKNPDVDERRELQRVPMLLDLAVVPVDENWTPLAKPVLGMMIDVTANGLGMVTPTHVEAEHAAVQIQHPAGLVQLLGRIAWSKDFGPGFHNAGMQFLLRFGRCTITGQSQPAPLSKTN